MGALYTLYIQTSGHRQMLDITTEVKKLIRESKVNSGLCSLFLPHTTAGLLITENRDPYLATDFTKAMHMISGSEENYHNLENNFSAHLCASLIGVSKMIPIEDGKLALGSWQSIYLMEFDGSRKRKVLVKLMEDA